MEDLDETRIATKEFAYHKIQPPVRKYKILEMGLGFADSERFLYKRISAVTSVYATLTRSTEESHLNLAPKGVTIAYNRADLGTLFNTPNKPLKKITQSE